MTDLVATAGTREMPKVTIGPVTVDGEVLEKGVEAASKLHPSTFSSILYSVTIVAAVLYLQFFVGPEHIKLLGEKLDPLTKAISAQTERNDKHLLEQNAILREALKLRPLGAANGPGE